MADLTATPTNLEEAFLALQRSVCTKREEIPKRCAAVISSNLKLQLEHTQKTIRLPKNDLRKPGFKYPTGKPLEETFDLHKSEVPIEHLPELIAQRLEGTQPVFEAIRMLEREQKPNLMNFS